MGIAALGAGIAVLTGLGAGMSLETEVKAESIKKAIASIEYTAKKMNGEITSIQKGGECEDENQGCQSD